MQERLPAVAEQMLSSPRYRCVSLLDTRHGRIKEEFKAVRAKEADRSIEFDNRTLSQRLKEEQMVKVVRDKEADKFVEFDNRTLRAPLERVAVTNLP
jgi:hypothetical protein